METSASLLLRIRDPHDNKAWDTFVGVYSPLVRRYCQLKGFQAADADDVTQEVLTTVVRTIASFEYSRERGRFRGWLGTVTTRAMASFRTRTRRAGPELPLEIDPAWDRGFAEHVLAVALDRVRSEFEPETWSAFDATWIRRERPADVATRLGIALHAVYVNKSRVLKRLEAEVLALAEDCPLPPT
jgi:RNA polymerase sigma-70 factor (ECF subfamily)